MNKNTDSDILVFGYHGQVATALRERLPQTRFLSSQDLDLKVPEKIAETLSCWMPKTIINAAAYTAVDKAEIEPVVAELINLAAVREMAKWCAENSSHLVYYSTDYVFNGEKAGAYMEDDKKDPLNEYGRTKSQGEDAILAAGCSYQIMRVSWVYSPWGKNFVKSMLKLGQQQQKLRVVSDQFGMPTSAIDIAATTLKLIENSEKNGIYHFCGEGATNWYEFALEIFAQAREEGIELLVESVEPISSSDYPTTARRPQNSMLSCNKIFREFGVDCPQWKQSLRSVIERLAKEIK